MNLFEHVLDSEPSCTISSERGGSRLHVSARAIFKRAANSLFALGLLLALRCPPRICRSIKTLANFEPLATDDEIRAAAVQFVRKLSGTTFPSRANEATFDRAVDEVTSAATRLIHELHSTTAPRNREIEVAKARSRAAGRYAHA